VDTASSIPRHRAALRRTSLSLPATNAVADGLIHPGTTVLDYGCGHGDDVRRLQALGIPATGWDPHYAPHPAPSPADVVLCSYVLNVIEDPAERAITIRNAGHLARKALVVAVRTPWDAKRLSGDPLADGVVTSRGTFQTTMRPEDLRTLLHNELAVRPVAAVPGVSYVFLDKATRLDYLERRFSVTGGTSGVRAADQQHTTEDLQPVVGPLATFLETHGRQPTADETPELIILARRRFGSLSRAHEAARQVADEQLTARSARRRGIDVLVVLAEERFHGRGPLSDLPPSLAADVRAFHSTYQQACKKADWLLWALSQPDKLTDTIRRARVGKLTPTARYVHRSALGHLPALLRLYDFCATLVIGQPADANIVKLHHDKAAVSFLTYPEFDRDPHPRLGHSCTVNLTSQTAEMIDYTTRGNRPLLHRKEEFLAPDHPDVPKYQRLTAQEVRAGLYTNPSIIGTEDGWSAVLQERQVALRGHRLTRLPSIAQEPR
jgi:DNA phosphorothioation-associated putative methyltransferase